MFILTGIRNGKLIAFPSNVGDTLDLVKSPEYQIERDFSLMAVYDWSGLVLYQRSTVLDLFTEVMREREAYRLERDTAWAERDALADELLALRSNASA